MIHWIWANWWYFCCSECFLRNHGLKMKDALGVYGYVHILFHEEILVSSFLPTSAPLSVSVWVWIVTAALGPLPVIRSTIASVHCYKACLIMSVSLDYNQRQLLSPAFQEAGVIISNRSKEFRVPKVQNPRLFFLDREISKYPKSILPSSKDILFSFL